MSLYSVTHMVLRRRRHGDEGSDEREYSTPEKIQALMNQQDDGQIHHQHLPIARVPPVRVEVSIGEASNLRKGA